MANVPFIQYMLPDGRKKPVMIDRPDNIAAVADNIRSHGFRFEIEVLRTGLVSMTVSDDDGDYHQKICRNGPAIPDAVDTLISTFDLAAAIKQREEDK